MFGAREAEPLLPPGAAEGFFEYRRRPRRDIVWLYAYLLVLIGALAGGIYAFVNRNPEYATLLKPESLSDPKLCPLPADDDLLTGIGSRRRLLVRKLGEDDAWQADQLLGSGAALLGVSAAGAILLGVVLLLLARHHPRLVVWGALAVQVGVPTAAGVGQLATGHGSSAAGLLFLGGLLALTFALWREQIELVVRLLGVAGRALSVNIGLIPLALGLQLVLGLLEVPLVLAALSGLMNGHLAYNDARVDKGSARYPGECVDANQDVVPCCAWQTDAWVAPIISLASLAALWTLFLISQVKVYVVSGAVGQWYFEPITAAQQQGHPLAPGSGGPGASSKAPGGPGPSGSGRRSRVGLSLSHAVGPSLGSLCCASAVLTLASMLRQALEKARKEARNGNMIAACAVACASIFLTLMETLTRFATVRAALSGEAFFDAGRAVTDLLKRNFLDAFGVWWLPPLVLQSACAVLAGGWAVGVFFIGRAVWSGMPQGSSAAIVMALLAFFASWAVLAFCAGLLLNVVDAVFVCFGMERDARQAVRPEVYEVYCLLPTVGPLVEQPDGGMAYGAPQHGHPQYPPPQQYYYSAPPQQQYPPVHQQAPYGGLPTRV